jgi:choice-of-anchor A domain-containing protein
MKITSIQLSALATAALATVVPSVASATNYNVFVSGNFTGQNSDTEGAIAAGGDVKLNNYSVGSNLNSSSNGNDTLVAGGSFTATNGQSNHGNLVAGSTVTTNSFNVANGTTSANTQSIDFAASVANYVSYSNTLASYAANGTTNFLSWGSLTLTGTNSGLNVFNVSTTSQLYQFNINIPSGSYALINWTGNPATFQNHEIATSAAYTNVLFNFVDATSLTINGYNFKGSAIAPNADVKFSNGQFNGQLVAKSAGGVTGQQWEATGEYHSVVADPIFGLPDPVGYTTPTPGPVPEPATWAMMIVGFGMVGGLARRRKGAVRQSLRYA